MHGHTTGLWPRNEKDIEVTDYPDLIARLRETAKLSYPTATPDEAADALEKQARRIAELEYDATYHESNDEVMMRDIEYYRARIAELNERLFDYETKFLNLRSAMKPFVSYPKDPVNVAEYITVFVKEADLRAARAAYLGEKG